MKSPPEFTRAATSPTDHAESLRSGTLQVLIVDDDKDGADLLADLLVAHGYEVHTAYDSLGALESVSRTVPNVAILDIDLPVLDGYRLAERLRARPELSGMRLLALTGHGGLAAEKRADAAGFHCLFTKPVDAATLLPAFTEPRLKSDEAP